MTLMTFVSDIVHVYCLLVYAVQYKDRPVIETMFWNKFTIQQVAVF